jgi:hypothetical protein
MYFSKNDTTLGYDPGHWTPWEVIPGGVLQSEAGVAVLSGQTLLVSALGTNARYHSVRSENGGLNWSEWTIVDNGALTFSSAPALVTAPGSAGAVTLFGTGSDGRMWTTRSLDRGTTWGTFEAVPALRFSSAPAAVSPAEGSIFTFAVDADSAIWMDQSRQPTL